MKRKIASAVLILVACVAFVFAARQDDACAKSYAECSTKCENDFRNCRTRQTAPDECERRQKRCMRECDKAKEECEAKGGSKGASPTATPGRKK